MFLKFDSFRHTAKYLDSVPDCILTIFDEINGMQ